MPEQAIRSAKKNQYNARHTYIRKKTIIKPKHFDRKSIIDHSGNGPMVVNDSEESEPEVVVVPQEDVDPEEQG